MFLLLGPNTALAHNGVLFMIESQVGYVIDCLGKMAKASIKSIMVKESVAKQFKDDVSATTSTRNISSPCGSWYKHKDGSNFILWPSSVWHYFWITRKAEIIEEYEIST